jgi:hypothetical protein
MIVFHELAYEGYVHADLGSHYQYSDPSLMELIGAVDVVHVSGYSTQASGTTPTLFVNMLYSNDRNYFWFLNFGSPLINSLSLSTSGETFFQAVHSQAALPRLAYGQLRIQVLAGSGVDARAFLRVWVTGRDRSRRSAASSQTQAMPRPMSGVANGRNGMLRQKG